MELRCPKFFHYVVIWLFTVKSTLCCWRISILTNKVLIDSILLCGCIHLERLIQVHVILKRLFIRPELLLHHLGFNLTEQLTLLPFFKHSMSSIPETFLVTLLFSILYNVDDGARCVGWPPSILIEEVCGGVLICYLLLNHVLDCLILEDLRVVWRPHKLD